MGDKTGIAWTDATWNPTRGCRRVAPECEHCYAEHVAARFSGPGMPYEGLAKFVTLDGGRREPRWTGVGRTVPHMLAQPLRWQKPRMIFVDSMSDLFFEAFSFEEIAAVFGVMALADWHTFQVLTKRPGRMRAFFDWLQARAFEKATMDKDALWWNVSVCVDEALSRLPEDVRSRAFAKTQSGLFVGPQQWQWPLPNVWLGTSAGSRKTLDAYLMDLMRCPAAVRFLSAEPLIEGFEIGLRGTLPKEFFPNYTMCHDRLNWVIVGGESQDGARPCDLAWIRALVAECKDMDVPVFVKQLGSVVAGRDCEHGRAGQTCHFIDRAGADPSEWPEDLRVQEFPPLSRAA